MINNPLGKSIENIESAEEIIMALEELYVQIMKQKKLTKNHLLSDNFLEEYEAISREAITGVTEKIEDDRQKIEILKGIIEEKLEYETDKEVKEANEEFFSKYYNNLKERISKIRIPDRNEKIILGLIKDSKARIHEDKGSKPKWKYGDFVIDREKKPEIIYQDKNMQLIKKSTYQALKSEKDQETSGKVVANLEKSEICKYEFQIEYEPEKLAAIQFFGETKLGDKIKEGKIEYFSPMLAAIAKAKEEGREHIGNIELIDKDLGTFVTQYDDNKEQRIKILKRKEELLSRRDKPSREQKSK